VLTVSRLWLMLLPGDCLSAGAGVVNDRLSAPKPTLDPAVSSSGSRPGPIPNPLPPPATAAAACAAAAAVEAFPVARS
jgi:hypothetical protein